MDFYLQLSHLLSHLGKIQCKKFAHNAVEHLSASQKPGQRKPYFSHGSK